MRVFLLFILSSFPVFADVCICQHPQDNPRFGEFVRGEKGFYKLGCAVWLAGQKDCRRQKITSINLPLDSYLEKVLDRDEKVKIGYVGHWKSSPDYVEYIDEDIVPLYQKFKVSFEITNTACKGMQQAEIIQDYLNKLVSPDGTYLRVTGSQTTSIGVWDKVLPDKINANLMAIADSRLTSAQYPLCKEVSGKSCTAYQEGGFGLCEKENGELNTVICHKSFKKKKSGEMALKDSKKWLLETDIKKWFEKTKYRF